MGVMAYVVDKSGEMVTDATHGLGRFESADLLLTLGFVARNEEAEEGTLRELIDDTLDVVRKGEEGVSAQQLIRNARLVLNQNSGMNGEKIDNRFRDSVKSILNFAQRELRIAKSREIDPASLDVVFFDTSQ